jgi:hypothetical protein
VGNNITSVSEYLDAQSDFDLELRCRFSNRKSPCLYDTASQL